MFVLLKGLFGMHTWHGLNANEWISMLDRTAWRYAIHQTLRDIACNSDADGLLRMSALELMSEAINAFVLPPDPALPQLVVAVTLEITRGCRPRWWVRAKRLNQLLAERLAGARVMIRTASQFTVQIARQNAELEAKASAGMLS